MQRVDGTAEELPSLSVTQLHYLCAIADHPTWRDAAQSVHVSPSALSQAVAELERRLGLDLFVRDGRRRVPRPEAQPVFEYARTVVTQTEDLARWAAQRRAGRTGLVRVGMIDVAAIHHFADDLARFRTDRPEVTMVLSIESSGELCRRVREGLLDLAVVVAAPNRLDGLLSTYLLTEPLAVFAPPGTGPLPASQWGPFVLFPSGSHTRSLVAEALLAAGAPLDIAAESNQPEVLEQMVRLGMGWTVLPVSQVGGGGVPLVRVTADALVERDLVVVRRPDRLDHPAAESLEQMLVG